MTYDYLPTWSHEPFDNQPNGIKQMLVRMDQKTKELDVAWIEFNETGRVGRQASTISREELIKLTHELAQELPFLQKQYDSNSLDSTDAYLIVLNAQQILLYSFDELGMV